MSLHNLARVVTTTTGTGTITLGTASPGFLTFADAGVANAEVVTYSIRDGANSEIGRGTYTASGTTLSRDTILKSTNGGSAISLSGNAEVFITAAAEDLPLNKAITMWHDQSVITVGAALTRANYSAHAYAYVTYQNAALNGDTWTNGFICPQGVYTLHFLATTDGTRGIDDIYVDNVKVGTIDFYSASGLKNQDKTIASVTISAGYHTLKGVVNGKNASSSGYIIALTKMWLTPAAY